MCPHTAQQLGSCPRAHEESHPPPMLRDRYGLRRPRTQKVCDLSYPQCRDLLNAKEIQTHTKECPDHVRVAELNSQHQSGPEIRIQPEGCMTVVIDVTSSTLTSAESMTAAFRAREKVKENKYRETVEANGEDFLTVVFYNG
jgi:hypothetical protein